MDLLKATVRWLAAVLACAWVLFPALAAANCLPTPDASLRELQNLVDRDAARALKEVHARIDAAGGHAAPSMLAALHAIEAQSYSILELDAQARDSAQKGLALAPGASDPVHVDLLTAYAENVYDAAGIDGALRLVDAARSAQARGTLAGSCLLITQGLLQYRQDRADLAVASLIQAYRDSSASSRAGARILAASVLSTVMRGTGDYPQALALNQEVIDWDARRGATLSLSVSRYLRGKILNLMGRNEEAIDQLGQARALSLQLDDIQGVAYADFLDCTARIELGQLERAASSCNDALRVFAASSSADEVKETEGLLARIDLAQGHAQEALARLNRVLDRQGEDLLPIRVASLYESRARANAALHNYRDAYADLAEYTRRYVAANDAEKTKTAAALRARFETDREIERNTRLKRELVASREEAQRQARELKWNAIAATLGAVIILLLIYFLIVNRSYRHRLIKLASQDGLTGLANRRRTAEFAGAALAEATATGRTLTIAIIDLDHFKVINDRCGHAAGDHVLKEFARVGRESIRGADVLGRWGGEEFLLVMPDTTLEAAIATLERMRTLMFGINLPASGAGMRVSLSAGVAISSRHGRSLDEMIARADSALYVAKNEGRDLVRIAEDSHLSTTSIRRVIRH
ncbi:MAG TPA: diguanylate cyclase [Steroidobacteraceae bacterium]|jgi:diguanylate cyclase (GGDEF)-like protein|nr:diguanylate cyclase [Steroidobacteraceae bacterium]